MRDGMGEKIVKVVFIFYLAYRFGRRVLFRLTACRIFYCTYQYVTLLLSKPAARMCVFAREEDKAYMTNSDPIQSCRERIN